MRHPSGKGVMCLASSTMPHPHVSKRYAASVGNIKTSRLETIRCRSLNDTHVGSRVPVPSNDRSPVSATNVLWAPCFAAGPPSLWQPLPPIPSHHPPGPLGVITKYHVQDMTCVIRPSWTSPFHKSLIV